MVASRGWAQRPSIYHCAVLSTLSPLYYEGLFHDGFLQVCFTKNGVMQVDPVEVGVPEVGAVQLGVAQGSFMQDGAAQVGPVEDGAAEVGLGKLRASKTRPAQEGFA